MDPWLLENSSATGFFQRPSSQDSSPVLVGIAEILLAIAKHHESNKEEAIRVSVDQLHITPSPIQDCLGNPIIRQNWDAEILPTIFINGGGESWPFTNRHDVDQAINQVNDTSDMSSSCWDSQKSKPITYPSECDDMMSGLTFRFRSRGMSSSTTRHRMCCDVPQ